MVPSLEFIVTKVREGADKRTVNSLKSISVHSSKLSAVYNPTNICICTYVVVV